MVKTINDYVDAVNERFPTMNKKEIKRILSFGWKMYQYVNRRGCDFLIKDDMTNKFTMFTGYLTWDSLKHYQRSVIKWGMKERVLHQLRRTEWDGYYYMGLRESQHEETQAQLNNKRRKTIKFLHAFCHKVKEEFPHNHAVKHVYRFRYRLDVGYKFYVKNFEVRREDLEYVGINEIKVWPQKN
jgi:hypothetical protein